MKPVPFPALATLWLLSALALQEGSALAQTNPADKISCLRDPLTDADIQGWTDAQKNQAWNNRMNRRTKLMQQKNGRQELLQKTEQSRDYAYVEVIVDGEKRRMPVTWQKLDERLAEKARAETAQKIDASPAAQELLRRGRNREQLIERYSKNRFEQLKREYRQKHLQNIKFLESDITTASNEMFRMEEEIKKLALTEELPPELTPSTPKTGFCPHCKKQVVFLFGIYPTCGQRP